MRYLLKVIPTLFFLFFYFVGEQELVSQTCLTLPATSVTASGATLNGTVNAGTYTTTVYFDYGTTVLYGTSVSAVPGTVTGTIVTSVDASLSGLTPNTLYHFRIRGESSNGTSTGIDRTFDLVPTPSITGPSTACAGTEDNTYVTQSGKSNYAWTVSAGGTKTAGGTSTSDTIVVTWNTAGPQSVSVNYENSVGDTASSATVYPVTVYPLPVPTISSPALLTESFENGGSIPSNWSLETITANNTVTFVSASTHPISYSAYNGTFMVRFNSYEADNGVIRLKRTTPVSTNGFSNVSVDFAWLESSSYSTENDRVEVEWSADGTNWNTAGTFSRYNAVQGWKVKTQALPAAAAGLSTLYIAFKFTSEFGDDCYLDLAHVTVSNTSVCAGTYATYATEAGMTAYAWTVSSGGTVTSGSGTNTITVLWNTAGSNTVAVNYTNSNSCKASNPTITAVTVNALPVPVITGSNNVCLNDTVIYHTQTGMTDYSWTASTGGMIIGTAIDSIVSVNWTTAGSGSTRWVKVSYADANGCPPATPTQYDVTVNVLPVPTITGTQILCLNTTATYHTETNKTGYLWAVSSGATINGTATDSVVSVTWDTISTGSNRWVKVTYTDASGCIPLTPTQFIVTVNPLPVPTISGSDTVCLNSTVTYRTQKNMTGYIWTVSTGGAINGTATDSLVSVTWNSSGSGGSRWVRVNYVDANGCTAASVTQYNVTVNLLPAPTISGLTSLCVTTTTTYRTQKGMTGYSWTTSSGGTINGTAVDSLVSVTWDSVGSASTRWVQVNYVDTNGCTAASPTQLGVTVNPVPVPTITGPATACVNSTVTYRTEKNMTGYLWTISTGGMINGTATDSALSVTWTTIGSGGTRWVRVTYTNTFNCQAAAPTEYPVTVYVNPVPIITGSQNVCINTSEIYRTEKNMTAYVWTVSTGATINGSSTDSTVNVTWNSVGSGGTRYVTVTYTDPTGCSAISPTQYDVSVAALPVPTISSSPLMTESFENGGSIPANWVIETITPNNNITFVNTTSYPSGYSAYSGTYMVRFDSYIAGNGVMRLKRFAPVSTLGYSNVSVDFAWLESSAYSSANDRVEVEWSLDGTTWNIAGTFSRYNAVQGWKVKTQALPPEAAGQATVYIAFKFTSEFGNDCYLDLVHLSPSNSAVCIGTSASYVTESGMSGYTWSISSGGTITSGSGTYEITVQWSTAGSKTVGVNYTNADGCKATNPTTMAVTVNSLPVPVITGSNNVCLNDTVIYHTQTGMTAYSWTVSTGGMIIGTSADSVVSVVWTIAGSGSTRWVKASYADANGCPAATPTQYDVTVNALPVPTITGTQILCLNTTTTYHTEKNMLGYLWTVSSGATINGTATDSVVSITWDTISTGSNRWVKVTYTNTSGCIPLTPTQFIVTVNPLPVPTITGLDTVCLNSTVTYRTEKNMTGYTWTVSTGGAINGTAADSLVSVTWNSAGSGGIRWVRVNYINANGCTAAGATQYNVTVYPLPVPTISGLTTVCVNTTTTYRTEKNKTGYIWTVSTGGLINGTAVDSLVSVTWDSVGADTSRWVKVNYLDTNGCTAVLPTHLGVTVNSVPVPTISGPVSACVNSTVTYRTEKNMTGYLWTISTGGIINGTSTDSTVSVTWNTVGSGGTRWVRVTYTNSFSCPAATPAQYDVTVYFAPVPTITGPQNICMNSPATYHTQTGMVNYLWTISAGGSIIGSATDSVVNVNWNLAGSGGTRFVTVTYSDPTGCSAASPTQYDVTVDSLPVPTISSTPLLTESFENGGSIPPNWVLETIAPNNTVTFVSATSHPSGYTAYDGTYMVRFNSFDFGNGVMRLKRLAPVSTVGYSNVNVDFAWLESSEYSSANDRMEVEWSVDGTTWNSAGTYSRYNAVPGWKVKTLALPASAAGQATLYIAFRFTSEFGNDCYLDLVHISPGYTGVCVGSSASYVTESGMTAYAWTVSSGGTITSGAGTNAITVLWNVAGSQTVGVNYTNLNSCKASNPTIAGVIVSTHPVPTVSGPAEVCLNDTVNYRTEKNMSGYFWTVSTGGMIVGTASDSIVIVAWNIAGSGTDRWVKAIYANANGCAPLLPTQYFVSVNTPPVPTITGIQTLCVNSATTYHTETAKTGYLWTISSGATINGTATDSVVTVTWDSVGSGSTRWVNVSYTDTSGCTPVTPTQYNVTVNALPLPTISGPDTVCLSTTNTYRTEKNMTGYTWTVSTGGTINGAATDSLVSVTWNAAGSGGSRWVKVNYVDANGCTAPTAFQYDVTVVSVPVPFITGLQDLCVNTTATYQTNTGMLSYSWTVSTGGTINGTNTDSVVSVTWNSAGSGGTRWVNVSYIDTTGCTASVATQYDVTVNPLPVPTISSQPLITESFENGGALPPNWSLQTVIPNNTVSFVSASSHPAGYLAYNGTYFVRFNSYDAGNGVIRLRRTIPVSTVGYSNVTVDFAWLESSGYPASNDRVEVEWSVNGTTWSTAGSFPRFNAIDGWKVKTQTLPAGAAGQSTLYIAFKFTSAFGNDCYLDLAHVNVNNSAVCVGNSSAFMTEPGMLAYFWSVTSGGTITSGLGTNSIIVRWDTAGIQSVGVNYTNTNGCKALLPTMVSVEVNPVPIPTISGSDNVCLNDTVIYHTEKNMTGYLWSVSSGGTINGTPNDSLVSVTWNTAGTGGSRWVQVTYVGSIGCPVASPTQYPVIVNPVPVATITGSSVVCQHDTTFYYTQTGMLAYLWSISSGGTILGSSTDSTLKVKWDSVGSGTTRWVQVTFADTNGCSPSAPALLYLTVNALPVPAISGPNSVCLNSTATYRTEKNMTAYMWTVSPGGVINGTTTDSLVSVTWNTAGSGGTRWVSVTYTGQNGCMATSPTQYPVTVSPMPVPTISGPQDLCLNTTAIYQTQPNKIGYIWTVSTGGTINGSANDSVVSITWNIAGSGGVRWVKVIYSDTTGCPTAASPQYDVTVNPIPVPTISSPPLLSQSFENGGLIPSGWALEPIAPNNAVTFVTTSSHPPGYPAYDGTYMVRFNSYDAAGGVIRLKRTTPVSTIGYNIVNVNFAWLESSGYITANDKVEMEWSLDGITWNTAGIFPRYNPVQGWKVKSLNLPSGAAGQATLYIAFKFTSAFGNDCYLDLVKVSAGNTSVCIGNSASYVTEPGMTAYAWTVSSGGTITSGSGTNAITVMWTAAGSNTVGVNYTDPNGCKADNPTILSVLVNTLPVPTISGSSNLCLYDTITYQTEIGMTNYIWTVSTGGTIIGVATDSIASVVWTIPGSGTERWVKATYINANGCVPVTPTQFNVTVNSLPVPTVSGPLITCVNSTATYRTQKNMSGYLWTISTGGAVIGSANDSVVNVVWYTVGTGTTHWVKVTYADSTGCLPASPAQYFVTVVSLPTPTISGPAGVCLSDTVTYRTEKFMTGYVWTVSTGGTIVGTPNDSIVNVAWTAVGTGGIRWVRVTYTDVNGCLASSPTQYNVTVNSLPAPVITGLASVCRNITATYRTQKNMTGYTWTVSSGATINGTANDSLISVTWDSVSTGGNRWLKVNYLNANGCKAVLPTQFNVTVHPLPVPSLTGPTSVCFSSAGNIYQTEAGMNTYTWVIVNGTVTAGGTVNDRTVTVTWNLAPGGIHSVAVSYTNSLGCIPDTSTVLGVNVHALPSPTITGPTSVCANSSGHIYSTESGMGNYVWTLSAGGTITAGAGTNSIAVTWNGAGLRTVAITYIDTNGCSPLMSAQLQVAVNPVPVATISGPLSACVNSAGNIYSTTGGMTNYSWTVSAGGVITTGAGTSTITVTWNTAGAQNLSVSYTSSAGCPAISPFFGVTVYPLPQPTITGPVSSCTGLTGNIYSTQPGMTGYLWTLSAGGTITSGAGSSSISVTWNSPGAQTVNVTYTGANGCAGTSPTFGVTVLAGPTPTIAGPTSACISGIYIYSTETGMNNYLWTISSGGTIMSGAGTSQIQVSWQATGTRWVAVNYSNSSGCTGGVPTQLDVTVTSLPGSPGNITGAGLVCAGQTGVPYSISPVPNATSYTWLFPPGATIVSGAGTASIVVDFSITAVSGVILVYGTNACGNGPSSSSFPVLVNKPPAEAGTITGLDTVCKGATGVNYFISPIPAADSYVWSLPPGATIASGANSPSIFVNFSTNATPGVIAVYATNYCGAGLPSPNFMVTTVSPLPAPVITQIGDVLYSDQPIGNQWYFEGSPIPGATGQSYLVLQDGEYWDVVTRYGCSAVSNHIIVVVTGIDDQENSGFSVHPVPNDGIFTVSMRWPGEEVVAIRIYNNLGMRVYELQNVEVKYRAEQKIDLKPVPNGVYTVVVENDHIRIVRKIIVIN